MKPSPLVTLIMPVWSPRPEWLFEAVSSALGQEACRIELIVVDDGCETPVAGLLARVDDERLRVLRIGHGRVSRARNAAIEAARGEYFRFIDCDDVIVADSTAHLLGLAGDNDRVVAYGATLVCDEELRPLSKVASRLQGWVAEPCLLNRFKTTIHSLLFPRRVIEAIGPWEPSIRVSQDWDYALRAFDYAPVRGDRRVATYYRMHAGMNSRDVCAGMRGYRQVVERYFEHHPELRGSRLERRAKAGMHVFTAGRLSVVLGEHRQAFDHLRRAFVADPITAVRVVGEMGAGALLTSARKGARGARARSPGPRISAKAGG